MTLCIEKIVCLARRYYMNRANVDKKLYPSDLYGVNGFLGMFCRSDGAKAGGKKSGKVSRQAQLW
jgi:hypothetical protein